MQPRYRNNGPHPIGVLLQSRGLAYLDQQTAPTGRHRRERGEGDAMVVRKQEACAEIGGTRFRLAFLRRRVDVVERAKRQNIWQGRKHCCSIGDGDSRRDRELVHGWVQAFEVVDGVAMTWYAPLTSSSQNELLCNYNHV